MLTAVLPAHNEAASIAATVRSLKEQTVPPDRILVSCDNCTDDTRERAEAAGAETFVTVGNTARKAGALNQALATLSDQDYVLIADADTELAPGFLERALKELESNPQLGAVGGIFDARRPKRLIELFQANEYARYALELERTQRVMVLSGTAAVVRAEVLRDVANARGSTLPGVRGHVYDESALTEDNELTLALKTIGWKLISPPECKTYTEVMPDVSSLWKQRLRWYRGAIDNLLNYGFTRVTRRYWFQQGMLLVGTLAMGLYLAILSIDIALGLIGFNPLWALIGLLFWTERFVTASSKGRGIAAAFVPELIYEIGLQWVFIAALRHAITKKETRWHHLGATV